MKRPDTPNCDLLEASRDKSLLLSEFIRFLFDSRRYILAQHPTEAHQHPIPVHVQRDELIGDFLGIDRDELEKEKQELLAYLRHVNTRGPRK